MTAAFDCAISTVPRDHDYIHSLLGELNCHATVRLVVGKPDSRYVSRYRSCDRFEIIELSESDWDQFKDSNVHHRATYNYWRCLTLGRRQSNADLLVLEDDLTVARGWERRLGECLRDVRRYFGDRFVLSLYSPHELRRPRGSSFAKYPIRSFFGTQAMFYSRAILEGLCESIRRRGVESNEAPYDMLIKEHLERDGIPLLSTVPSLFDHVGRATTGLGNYHRAAHFRKYLYPGFNPIKQLDQLMRTIVRAKNYLATRAPKRKAPETPKPRIVFPDQTFQSDGMRVVHTRVNSREMAERKQQWQRFVETAPPAPARFPRERGIVICAGGVRFLTCAYVNVKILRRHGCQLPIELWHLDNEISKEFQLLFKSLNVECRNAREASGVPLYSFQTKPFAILHSEFREVLFLDADNTPVRDPADLFDHPEYQKHGVVFWPDYWKTDPANAIWRLTGCPPDDSYEQDSGQILIDKARNWRELQLACHFNQSAEFYYQWLNGDKDTFKFAWRALRTPYVMIHRETGQCGYTTGKGQFIGTTMVQHDFNSKILFLHRNLRKWDTTRDGEMVWHELRRFSQHATHREYYLNTDGILSMGLVGHIDTDSFIEQFPNLEKDCLNYLRELRESPAYSRFLIENYILYFRPRGE